jgi:CheY-like chemotaxis protein
MKILIIEDEAANRDPMIHMLEAEGYEVCWAKTGSRGLELMASERVDLVLLDMMLPDMNGWEIARRKLSNPKTAPIPLIVISGMSSEEIRAHTETNPMASVLVIFGKPPDMPDFLKAISHIEEIRKLDARENSS